MKPEPETLAGKAAREVLANCADKYVHPQYWSDDQQSVINQQLANAERIISEVYAEQSQAVKELLEAADSVVYGSVAMNAVAASTEVSALLKYHKLRKGFAEIPDDDPFRKQLRAERLKGKE